jgi:DNA-binding NtrC family response regulator
MTYMTTAAITHDTPQASPATPGKDIRRPLIVVVEDDSHLSKAFWNICEHLNVDVGRISRLQDLSAVLRDRQPMAIAADLDAHGRDGCHVLMIVAAYDRLLPVLLVTNGNPSHFEAVVAAEEALGLTAVTKWSSLPEVGDLVEFLFRAGRRGNSVRLMPV